MSTAVCYLMVGWCLGIVTWMLFAPQWHFVIAFAAGEVAMLYVFSLAALFDWIVGRWLRGELRWPIEKKRGGEK